MLKKAEDCTHANVQPQQPQTPSFWLLPEPTPAPTRSAISPLYLAINTYNNTDAQPTCTLGDRHSWSKMYFPSVFLLAVEEGVGRKRQKGWGFTVTAVGRTGIFSVWVLPVSYRNQTQTVTAAMINKGNDEKGQCSSCEEQHPPPSRGRPLSICPTFAGWNGHTGVAITPQGHSILGHQPKNQGQQLFVNTPGFTKAHNIAALGRA